MVRDTSKDYEDLTEPKDKVAIRSDLTSFIGDVPSKPDIQEKPFDPLFPEKWQRLFVNFNNHEEYVKFMHALDRNPNIKEKKIVYSKTKKDLSRFM